MKLPPGFGGLLALLCPLAAAVSGACAGIKPSSSAHDAATTTGNDARAGMDQRMEYVPVPDTIGITCGNGRVDSGELCDDGNTDNGDGCNRLCRVEAEWSCPTPGMACVSRAVCGDGMLASNEGCDDGNDVGGDGCSADCKTVETNWQCRVPGRHCVPLCGDGIITGGENCDDHNAASGDGCSSTCLIEPGWSCDASGCVKSVCGNGKVEAGEGCDKGPLNGLFYGDASGCSKTCTREPSCRNASGVTTACAAVCGDGNVDAGEGCDDGNTASGDGCSAACAVENGFTCTADTQKDTRACASGAGNCLLLPITYRDFDGQNLPSGHPDFFFYGATVGTARTLCVPNASGKPAVLNGNCANTDSTSLCTGLVNGTLGAGGKPTLNTTRGSTCDCRFTDWDRTGILTAGMANVTQCTVTGDGSTRQRISVPVQVIQSASSFNQWYGDSALSTKVLGTIELANLAGTDQYQFSSSNGRTVYEDLHDIFLGLPSSGGTPPAGAVTSLSSGFFPLEAETRPKVCNIWPYWLPTLQTAAACRAANGTPVGSQWDPRGWYGGSPPAPTVVPTGGPVAPVPGTMRNFYFTSEVRYLFRYAGGESLSFYGDDDVWVFINGHLVLDLGAPHERLQGSVTLTTAGADWRVQAQDVVTLAWTPIAMGSVTGLGLQVGRTYEIAVFHADRHPRESNYQLTVSGFSTTRSLCQPRCGDGIVTAGEECDEGPDNADGKYGGCTTQCKFGPFCGDGTMNGPEECDLGRMNGTTYRSGEFQSGGCSTGCTLPHYCGDGIIDTSFGEECDDGKDVNGTPSSRCTMTCRLTIL